MSLITTKLTIEASQLIIGYLEASAVIVLSISGMIKAAQKKMDIVGAYALALLSAFGGGTLRDIMLERRPFFWIENDYFLFVILFICMIMAYQKGMYRLAMKLHNRSNTIDAIGLALFSLSGLIAALAKDISFLPASLIGVITGVAGGVIRDIIVNEIPVIFRPSGLYAIAAFIGCWIYILCSYLSLPNLISIIISSVVVVAIRLLSVFYKKSLANPVWIEE